MKNIDLWLGLVVIAIFVLMLYFVCFDIKKNKDIQYITKQQSFTSKIDCLALEKKYLDLEQKFIEYKMFYNQKGYESYKSENKRIYNQLIYAIEINRYLNKKLKQNHIIVTDSMIHTNVKRIK